MLPDNRTECCPHLSHLRDFATSGIKQIMDFAEHMKTCTDNLPDDLKPIGQALAEITMQVLIESYAESLRLIPEMGFQKIAQAAITPKHHTEPDSLERSMNDAI
jgi:hypothetical protein